MDKTKLDTPALYAEIDRLRAERDALIKALVGLYDTGCLDSLDDGPRRAAARVAAKRLIRSNIASFAKVTP